MSEGYKVFRLGISVTIDERPIYTSYLKCAQSLDDDSAECNRFQLATTQKLMAWMLEKLQTDPDSIRSKFEWPEG